ncbi:MAG: GNAT family N-acetyltransferase [Dehalococcoidia bacterium]
MEIAPATVADAPAAAGLLERFYAEEAIPTPAEAVLANVRLVLDEPSIVILLAWDGDRAVGVAVAGEDLSVEFGRSAELDDLYVLAEYRGSGLGRRLIEAVQDWAVGRGCGALSLVVTPEGQEAHDLIGYYRRLGFVSTGRLVLTMELPAR